MWSLSIDVFTGMDPDDVLKRLQWEGNIGGLGSGRSEANGDIA